MTFFMNSPFLESSVDFNRTPFGASNDIGRRDFTFHGSQAYHGNAFKATPEPRSMTGLPPAYGDAARSSAPPCRFFAAVVDECHASRFYARTMEFYLLEADHPVKRDVRCPMSDCRRICSDAKEMLWHLKDCAYIARGKFICPCCDKAETFRTASKKKCSWDRPNFGMKIQKSLKASAKFLGMLRVKPTECPNCHHRLHESMPGNPQEFFDDTTVYPTELEYLGDTGFAASKLLSQPDQDPFGSDPLSKIHPNFLFEFPGTLPLEMMDTSPRAELSDTDLGMVDIINKHAQFSRDLESASTIASTSSPAFSTAMQRVSQSTSYNTSPEDVSPPSTEFGSCTSAQVSPSSAGDSSAHRMGITGRQLSRLFRPRRHVEQAAVNTSYPLALGETAQHIARVSQSSHNCTTTETSPSQLERSTVAGSNNTQSGFGRPNSLSINTAFGASNSVPIHVSITQSSGNASMIQTMPTDMSSEENVFAAFTGQRSLDTPYQASPSSAPASASSNARSEDTTEDDLSCSICGFTPHGIDKHYKSYMNKHMKTHGGQRVECPECNKQFTRHDNMTHHLGKSHPTSHHLRKRPISSGSSHNGQQRKRALRLSPTSS